MLLPCNLRFASTLGWYNIRLNIQQQRWIIINSLLPHPIQIYSEHNHVISSISSVQLETTWLETPSRGVDVSMEWGDGLVVWRNGSGGMEIPLLLEFSITCCTQNEHLVDPRHCIRIHRLIYVSTYHLFQCVPVVLQPDDRSPTDAPHDKKRWPRRTDTMCKIVRVLTIASVTFPLGITGIRTNSYTSIYFTEFNSKIYFLYSKSLWVKSHLIIMFKNK